MLRVPGTWCCHLSGLRKGFHPQTGETINNKWHPWVRALPNSPSTCPTASFKLDLLSQAPCLECLSEHCWLLCSFPVSLGQAPSRQESGISLSLSLFRFSLLWKKTAQFWSVKAILCKAWLIPPNNEMLIHAVLPSTPVSCSNTSVKTH